MDDFNEIECGEEICPNDPIEICDEPKCCEEETRDYDEPGNGGFTVVEGSGVSGKKVRKDSEDGVVMAAQQWSDVNGCIVTASNTFSRLEAGYYSLHSSNSLGLYFVKEKVELNKLYRLPNEATDIIMNDISKFWTLEETYKKYHRVFRRNYLIYSGPGCGKSSLISLMCQELIEKYDGIVFYLGCEWDIEAFPNAVRRVRKIEPDRKIIAIIEDIDTFAHGNSSLNTLILNMLDGNLKLSGIVTIATTNHIEMLEDRYTNRPSRFDRVIEFPLPNADSRRMFIEKTVLPEDLKRIDHDEWVAKTEGFTVDHINELILLFFVFGHSEEESFETMFKMTNTKGMLKNSTSVNKKSIGFGSK